MSRDTRERRVLLMIRGFIDESEQCGIFVVAGWVAEFDTWNHFTEDWRIALDSEPAVKYFKHHEAKSNPPSGEFAGWQPKQIEDKITALVDVICRHEMYGVTSSLNTARFKAAFSGAAMPRKTLRSMLKLTTPYHWCVFSVHALVLITQIDQGQTDKKVDVIFDEMEGLLAECIACYADYKADLPSEVKAIAGTMTEANDKDVEALQAADLLAGQLTTKLRLGHSEKHLNRLASVHTIFESPAEMPEFERIPFFVQVLNNLWSSMQRGRAKTIDPDNT